MPVASDFGDQQQTAASEGSFLVFHGMTDVAEGVLKIGSSVEGGIIQQNDSGRRELGQEDVLNPGEEGISVDACPQIDPPQAVESRATRQ